jgi:hypothetical protein
MTLLGIGGWLCKREKIQAAEFSGSEVRPSKLWRGSGGFNPRQAVFMS